MLKMVNDVHIESHFVEREDVYYSASIAEVNDLLSFESRTSLVGLELGKLVSLFNLAVHNNIVNPVELVASVAAYSLASYAQGCLSTMIKDRTNITMAYHGDIWLKNGQRFKDVIIHPEKASGKKEFLKSILPGRGLAFLKRPKLGLGSRR